MFERERQREMEKERRDKVNLKHRNKSVDALNTTTKQTKSKPMALI